MSRSFPAVYLWESASFIFVPLEGKTKLIGVATIPVSQVVQGDLSWFDDGGFAPMVARLRRECL